MKNLQLKMSDGFTLLELMVVISIIGALASIAIPNYLNYRDNAQTVACQANRKSIEQSEMAYFIEHNKTSLVIDDKYVCPAGGKYVWLVSDPSNPEYPKIGCSIHCSQSVDVLASDNFDSGNADAWTETGRDWEVADGKYYGGTEDGSSYKNMTFFGNEKWTDYTVELDANLINGEGAGYGYGVYFRAQAYSKLDAYIFQYEPGWGKTGAFVFRKIVGGYEQSPFATVKAPEGYTWNEAEKHIKVVVSGDTFKAYINDIDGGSTPILEAKDSSYTAGSIGLRTWGSAQASFDNINVSENE